MARNSSLSFSPRLAASIFTSRMSAGASRKFKGPLGGDCSRLDRLAVLMYSAWLIVHRRNLQARRQAYSAHESLALAVRANKDEKLCSMSHPTSPTLRPCRVLAQSVVLSPCHVRFAFKADSGTSTRLTQNGPSAFFADLSKLGR